MKQEKDLHNICNVFCKNIYFKGKIGRFANLKIIAEIWGYDIIKHWISLPMG